MNSQEWLVLASLAAFAMLTVALTKAWRRGDEPRQRKISPREQAEAAALTTGGWYLFRDGAVYFVATDEQFLKECREGRVLPRDLVFIVEERQWFPATAVPLAGVVFPARYVAAPAPTSSSNSWGWVFLGFLFWWMTAISEIRNIVERSAGSPVADVVAVALILSTCLAAWHYIRPRVAAGWRPSL